MTSKSPDVASILRLAHKAIEEAKVPQALKPIAFSKAVDLLSVGKSASSPPPPADRTESAGGGGGDDAGAARRGTGTVVEHIADRLKVPAELVEEVFHHDEDDGLKLVLGTSKFESAKRGATKKIALLIASGRQGAGDEEWTSLNTIREVVKDFNRFDSANFAFTITKMDDVFLFTGTKPAERKVKVNRRGYEEAAKLVRALTGGDES